MTSGRIYFPLIFIKIKTQSGQVRFISYNIQHDVNTSWSTMILLTVIFWMDFDESIITGRDANYRIACSCGREDPMQWSLKLSCICLAYNIEQWISFPLKYSTDWYGAKKLREQVPWWSEPTWMDGWMDE